MCYKCKFYVIDRRRYTAHAKYAYCYLCIYNSVRCILSRPYLKNLYITIGKIHRGIVIVVMACRFYSVTPNDIKTMTVTIPITPSNISENNTIIFDTLSSFFNNSIRKIVWMTKTTTARKTIKRPFNSQIEKKNRK